MQVDDRDRPVRTGCVYAIINTVTGRTYVGASSGSAYRRISLHANCLRRNRGVSKALQRDWDHYGEDAFRGERLEIVTSIPDLPDREAFWIAEMGRRGIPIYNQRPGTRYPELIVGYVMDGRAKRRTTPPPGGARSGEGREG